MDYEKKYKEAFARAKGMYEGRDDAELAAYIFPELAESEDERIRRKMIEHFKSKTKETWCNMPVKGIIAYLEKQKEQKPISQEDFDKAKHEALWGEQKPAEWSEKHIAGIFEKVGLAKIVREQGNDDLTNALQDAMLELSKVGNIEWSEEDEEMIERLIRHTQKEFDELCNDRYGHQEIISDLKESCLERMNWLENRLKSLRPQPKQEKSDYITPHKQFFKWIYDRLVSVHKENPDADYMISFKKRIEELSFDNPSWEPSEDEERLIKTSISFLKDFADKGYENAVECIDWLKAKLNGNTCK